MYGFTRLAGSNFNFCTELSTETVDKINLIGITYMRNFQMIRRYYPWLDSSLTLEWILIRNDMNRCNKLPTSISGFLEELNRDKIFATSDRSE